MNILKTLSLLVFVSIVFVASVLMPPYISTINDQLRIGQLETEPIEKPYSSNAGFIDTQKRLLLLQGGDDVLSVTQNRYRLEPESVDEITEIAIEEIKKMQAQDLFPQMDCTYDSDRVHVNLTVYMDMKELNNSVKVWELNFYNQDAYFRVHIDADTHKIYQYMVENKAGNIAIGDEGRFPQRFSEYLGIPLSKEGMHFVRDNARDKEFHLCDGQIPYFLYMSDTGIQLHIMPPADSEEFAIKFLIEDAKSTAN